MRADRAARMIIEACRHGDATLTPGVQARLAIVINALAPNLFASINAAADRALLPRPSQTTQANIAREGTRVDPGVVKALLRKQTRQAYHQPQPVWG
jgi:hypothetical protein